MAACEIQKGRVNIDDTGISLEEILQTRKLVDQIHVDEKVRDYVVHIVFATRKPEQYKLDIKHFIQFGASPRATIFLTLAAKAWEFASEAGAR